MEYVDVSATVRSSTGKGEAHRTRAAGLVPAVFYGPGKQGVALAVAPKDIDRILKSTLGRNTLVKLRVDSKESLALLKDYQYHPVKRNLLHADFYEVALDREVEVAVPLVVTGKARGVTLGGAMQIIFRRIPVKCRPDSIPAKLEIDCTPLGMGDSLKISDLTLPPGVRVTMAPTQAIVAVSAPEKEEVVEEVAAEVAVVGAPVEGAVPGAAPAAPGAAPAAGAPAEPVVAPKGKAAKEAKEKGE